VASTRAARETISLERGRSPNEGRRSRLPSEGFSPRAPPRPGAIRTAGTAPRDCIFCNIAARRSPAHIVYEDGSAAAFLDLYPYTRGHLLVVPKHHAARLPELPAEDQAGLIHALGEVCRRVERLSPDYHVSLNAGARAGQVVFHVHFHVIPRYSDENPFLGSSRVRLQDEDAHALLRELAAP